MLLWKIMYLPKNKSIFLLVFFSLLVSIAAGVYFYYPQRDLYKHIEDKKAVSSRYQKFERNDIPQIKGLVLEKDDENKTLVLRQGLNEEIKVSASNAKISTTIWDENGESQVVTADYWSYILPRETQITGVCSDAKCEVLTSIFIHSQ